MPQDCNTFECVRIHWRCPWYVCTQVHVMRTFPFSRWPSHCCSQHHNRLYLLAATTWNGLYVILLSRLCQTHTAHLTGNRVQLICIWLLQPHSPQILSRKVTPSTSSMGWRPLPSEKTSVRTRSRRLLPACRGNIISGPIISEMLGSLVCLPLVGGILKSWSTE